MKPRSILLRIWDYFRPMWEGDDGKFSLKRALVFLFLWLIVGMVTTGSTTNPWQFYTFLVLIVGVMLILGVITAAQLIMMIKFGSKVGKIGGDSDSMTLNKDDDETHTDLADGPDDGSDDKLQSTKDGSETPVQSH